MLRKVPDWCGAVDAAAATVDRLRLGSGGRLREIYLHFWRGQQKRGTRREEEEEEEEDCGWVSLAPDYCPASLSKYEGWTHEFSTNEIVFPFNKHYDEKVLPEMY